MVDLSDPGNIAKPKPLLKRVQLSGEHTEVTIMFVI